MGAEAFAGRGRRKDDWLLGRKVVAVRAARAMGLDLRRRLDRN